MAGEREGPILVPMSRHQAFAIVTEAERSGVDHVGAAAASAASRHSDNLIARIEAARRHLSDILAGRISAHDEAIRELARHEHAPVLDVTTARLVASKGVRPDAAVAMAALLGGEVSLDVDWLGENAGIRLSANKPAGHAWCRTFLMIAPDVKWHAAGMLRLRIAAPATVIAALPGRPLRALLSHPVFDRVPHVIRGVSVDAGGCHVVRLVTKVGPGGPFAPIVAPGFATTA